ncbi:hypothetical protein PMAYCL1PPCAC_33383, partial [Pristionchus mayeri]
SGQLAPAEITITTWRKIFYVASLPCLALTMYAAFTDHAKHGRRQLALPQLYTLILLRLQPFPWGDGNHSLFHNKSEQYVPGVGFEEDRKHH